MRKFRDLLKPYRIERPFSGGKILFNLAWYAAVFFFLWPGLFRYLQQPDPHTWRRVVMAVVPLIAGAATVARRVGAAIGSRAFIGRHIGGAIFHAGRRRPSAHRGAGLTAAGGRAACC